MHLLAFWLSKSCATFCWGTKHYSPVCKVGLDTLPFKYPEEHTTLHSRRILHVMSVKNHISAKNWNRPLRLQCGHNIAPLLHCCPLYTVALSLLDWVAGKMLSCWFGITFLTECGPQSYHNPAYALHSEKCLWRFPVIQVRFSRRQLDF